MNRHDLLLVDIKGRVLADELKFHSHEEESNKEVTMVMDTLVRHEKKIEVLQLEFKKVKQLFTLQGKPSHSIPSIGSVVALKEEASMDYHDEEVDKEY